MLVDWRDFYLARFAKFQTVAQENFSKTIGRTLRQLQSFISTPLQHDDNFVGRFPASIRRRGQLCRYRFGISVRLQQTSLTLNSPDECGISFKQPILVTFVPLCNLC